MPVQLLAVGQGGVEGLWVLLGLFPALPVPPGRCDPAGTELVTEQGGHQQPGAPLHFGKGGAAHKILQHQEKNQICLQKKSKLTSSEGSKQPGTKSSSTKKKKNRFVSKKKIKINQVGIQAAPLGCAGGSGGSAQAGAMEKVEIKLFGILDPLGEGGKSMQPLEALHKYERPWKVLPPTLKGCSAPLNRA